MPGIMCFSLESKVFVKDKGSTSIKDLVVGDMVLSDEKGTYTKYYSQGHFDDKKHTNFLSIYTELDVKPLELTPGHMVYTAMGCNTSKKLENKNKSLHFGAL